MPIEVSAVGRDHSVEELRRELAEAREQLTATSEILHVISTSPTDLKSVLDTVAENAARICAADDAHIWQREGEELHVAASYGMAPLTRRQLTISRQSVVGRAVHDQAPVHVEDLTKVVDTEFPDSRGMKEIGNRTILAMPLLRKGEVIGAIMIRRKVARPFADAQIALLRIFADQAVIAIENTRLFEAEQSSKRELQESLEYQTAISEVLSVISRSPSQIGPVMETIASTARKLCQAERAIVWRIEEDAFRPVAFSGMDVDRIEQVLDYHLPLGSGSTLGRAAQSGRAVQIVDTLSEPGLSSVNMQLSRSGNVRTVFAVPLLRDGNAIGGITLSRTVVAPFTDPQIALVETFADQAVIAIENARLFEELQARTRELTESLEQQTATADVLRIISSSPGRLEIVFQTMLENATRICEANFGNLYLRDGEVFNLTASHNTPQALVEHRKRSPLRGPNNMFGRMIRTKRVVHVTDLAAEQPYSERDPVTVAGVELGGIRTVLIVPMLKNDEVIGGFTLFRQEIRRFSDKQVTLVEGFANQAVIAIENTRLFEEVQARNRELRVALEQQTATSELLKVIGRSTFDLQPVFEALAENAVKLCEAERSFIFRFDGQLLRVVATHNAPPELRAFVEQNPIAPGTGSATARAALYRRTVHIHDAQADPDYAYESRKVDPFRTIMTVPVLRADELLGVILIYRHEVRPFTPSHIVLLETFADQAGIAIENTRLVQEVQARNRDLTALGQVGRAVSSTLDLKVVMKTIVDRAVELSGTDGGLIFYFREDLGRFELGETTGLDEEVVERFRKLDIAAGQTGLGEAIESGKPLQVPDITTRQRNALRDEAIEAGLRAALIVPLLSGEQALGALVLQRQRVGDFPAAVVNLMQSFADQSAIALENARLFDEIAQKSRELEIASQHKSQFVANMSHELRTPLAAILGYAELMQEGFYEPLGQKSLDALTRIRSNGKHLLSLINTVLDIAKIESGQFTLNMAEYAIDSVVETVRSATESLAQNKKLTLKTEVSQSLPIGLGDEQRLTQVLLNLVGNAIKFTDAGEVSIAAGARNGRFAVSVTDTGPGIPLDQQDRIFDQFHQVDSSLTKVKGGTGLGLAIAKQIVEMHGGRIWVESTLGKGSTFQMELPTRAEIGKANV